MRPVLPPSTAIHESMRGPPSRNRCFTPRRSPNPSSPTAPMNRRSDGVRISAALMARNTVRITTSPRVSSPTPGAKSVSPLIRTETSVPSGNTVSKCASMATVRSPRPRRSASTLPTSSIHTESAPASCIISANFAARTSSMNGGAGISVSMMRSASVVGSSSSMTRNACWMSRRLLRFSISRSWVLACADTPELRAIVKMAEKLAACWRDRRMMISSWFGVERPVCRGGDALRRPTSRLVVQCISCVSNALREIFNGCDVDRFPIGHAVRGVGFDLVAQAGQHP